MLNKKYYILFLGLFLVVSNIFAQYSKHVEKSFQYPHKLGFGEFISQLNIMLASLPEDYIEEANSLIYAPLLSYNAKLGLPYGFNLNGSAATNIITHKFRLGPKWNYQINRFSFEVGYDLEFLWGKLNDYGFNNEVAIWTHYPGAALGFAFNNFTAVVKFELNYVTSIKQFTDQIEQSSDFNFINGFTVLAAIEQPFWKDNYLMLGLRMNYMRFYYPAWAVFPTWDRYSFIPEFVVGLNL